MTYRILKKIVERFPEENEYHFIEEPLQTPKLLKHFIRYLIHNDKQVYIETSGIVKDYFLDECAELGANFVIDWNGFGYGVTDSFYPMSRAITLSHKYPKSKFIVRVTINPDNFSFVEMLIEAIITMKKKHPRLEFVMDYQRPKRGVKINESVKNAQAYLKSRKCDIIIGRKCGGLTITPNTNIYPCPLIPRMKRKQFFGNADRDKNCIGTVRRGFFREIPQCNYCEAVK